MQNYRVINIKQLKNQGYLRYSFDVSIGPVTIKNCTLLEKDGKFFINLPSQKYEDANGYINFNQIVEMTEAEKKALTNYVLEILQIIIKNIKCPHCSELIEEMLVDHSHGIFCPFCQQRFHIEQERYGLLNP